MAVIREFVEACEAVLSAPLAAHGFEPLKPEGIGRETFVRYERAGRIVSIAYEGFNPPIFELFYPAAETGEAPVSWAERNGVPYCRRIPRLRVDVGYDDSSKESMCDHLRASVERLLEIEAGFFEPS